METGALGASGVITDSATLAYDASKIDRFSMNLSGSQNSSGSQARPEFQEFTTMLIDTHSLDCKPMMHGTDNPNPPSP